MVLKRGDIIDVLLRVKEKGKTRCIGYSGDCEAALYAVRTGVFDSLMTSINIADQEAIDLTLPEGDDARNGSHREAGGNTAIVGTSNPNRWAQNAKLLEAGPLLAEQAEAIRRVWRESGQGLDRPGMTRCRPTDTGGKPGNGRAGTLRFF